MVQRIKKLLKRSELIISIYDKSRKFYWKYCMSDKNLIKKKFKEKMDREVELENPTKFNDKLQWLKLNWYDPIATKCADKYKVREFVKEKIGRKYLNELYGVYESVEEINLDQLPKAFVLKATHGSGMNIICKNKEKMNWDIEFKKMRRWLKKDYYWRNREWVYKDIKPRIICEKYLSDKNNEPLKDYRFFCFNGEVKFIAVDFNILDKSKTKRNLYDLNWNLLDAEISYPKISNFNVTKPNKLDKLIDLSKKISEGFPHVRVDFYYINGKIYFGEMTFFHQSGTGEIRPEEFEIKMGNWLELPDLNDRY